MALLGARLYSRREPAETRARSRQGGSTMKWLDEVLGRDTAPIEYKAEERKIFAASFRIGWTIVGFGVLGVLAILTWCFGARTDSISLWALLGADLLVAGAASSVGALFGFVFGIPRTLDPASRAAVATAAKQGADGASHAMMAANTNLERISDWLTTLLVGATLVQIKDIVGWVGRLGSALFSGGQVTNTAIVPVIVIYFLALAFLGTYLLTRLYLTSAFQQTLGILTGVMRASDAAQGDDADKTRTAEQPEKVEEAVNAIEAAGTMPDQTPAKDAARIARLYARQVAAEQAAGGVSAARASALKAWLARAITDSTEKRALQSDLAEGRLTTGDGTLDAEIRTLLT